MVVVVAGAVELVPVVLLSRLLMIRTSAQGQQSSEPFAMSGLVGHFAGCWPHWAPRLERDEQEALAALPCCSKVDTVWWWCEVLSALEGFEGWARQHARDADAKTVQNDFGLA